MSSLILFRANCLSSLILFRAYWLSSLILFRANWLSSLILFRAYWLFSLIIFRVNWFSFVLPQGPPPAAGQPFKFTVAETCDRIKEEFSYLQAQYHRWEIPLMLLSMDCTIFNWWLCIHLIIFHFIYLCIHLINCLLWLGNPDSRLL